MRTRAGGVWLVSALALTGCEDEDHDDFIIDNTLDGELFMPIGPPVSAPSRPIQGGTLLVLADRETAVAGDPDRDQIYIANLRQLRVEYTIPLTAGDEPGRLVEDGAGRVHVALRRGGAILSLDPQTGQILERRAVCASPSGIAVKGNDLHIACAGGQLVTLPAAGGEATRTLDLPRDLRDVVVYEEQLLVSRFRSAEVLVVAPDGHIVRTVRPSDAIAGVNEVAMVPTVAWRLASDASGRPHLLHQRAATSPLGENAGDYAGDSFDGCDTIVQPVVSEIFPALDTQPPPRGTIPATLVTDLAFDFSGNIAVAATGNSFDQMQMLPEVILLSSEREDFACELFDSSLFFDGEITSVAWDGQGRVVALSREPAQLMLSDGAHIALSPDSRKDTGLQLFHMNPASGVACASCHPAGLDDGHVWRFEESGPRRSQTLAGTLAATAPYHWDGKFEDLAHLFAEVFMMRMDGAVLSRDHQAVFTSWLTSLEAVPPPDARDPAAVARGEALFIDPGVACSVFHPRPLFTNSITVDIGTGRMQVPSLRGVAFRAPFMHDGCAPTLLDRFGSCGGHNHGKTDHLSAGQLDDLIAYLETL